MPKSRRRRKQLPEWLGSDRIGHMTAAITVGCIIGLVGLGILVDAQSYSNSQPFYDRNSITGAVLHIFYSRSEIIGAFLCKVGLFIPLCELIMTCDTDVDSRTAYGPWYRQFWVITWKPYAIAIRHRSRLSHSVFPGTFLRLTYACLPLLAWWAYNTYQFLSWSEGPYLWGMASQTNLLGEVVHTLWWAALLAWQMVSRWGWLISAAVLNDIVHLLKDGYLQRYGLASLLFGRPKRRRSRRTYTKRRT